MVIGPQEIMGDILYRRHLFGDRHVCVIDAGHPLAGAMTLEGYAAARHLGVTYNGQWEPLFLRVLAAQAIRPERAPQVARAPAAITRSAAGDG